MSLFSNEVPELGKGTTINGSLIPDRIHVNIELTAASLSQTIFINPVGSTAVPNTSTWKVTAINSVFGTASSSGTFEVEVAASGVAIGSGTLQQTSTAALSGTVATPVSTPVINHTVIKAGGMVNVIIAGTMTGLVAGSISVDLQRVS